MATATFALGVASGIASADLSAVVPPSALQSWGWRIPFLLALPFGAVGLYVQLWLSETRAFQATASAPRPPTLRIVWRDYGPTVRAGFLLVGVRAGTVIKWFVFLPAHLVAAEVHPLPVALGCAAAGLLTTAIAAPAWGDSRTGSGGDLC
jgi:MHS family proline/betaine transporter-like MFS transporter